MKRDDLVTALNFMAGAAEEGFGEKYSDAKVFRSSAALISAQAAEIQRLRACLAEELSNADHIVSFYHRNGPQWTGKDGHEYEDTSVVVGRAEETAQKIRAALQHSPDGMGEA